MQRIAILRGISVLAMLAFGACDSARSPTAAEPAAAPRFNAAPTGLVATHPSGTEVLTWNAASGATGYEYRFLEEYTYDDYNAGTSITSTPGNWISVSGTSVDTGRTYTANSQCVWGWTASTTWYTDYYWEVRAIYPGGPSTSSAWVRANVVTC